MCFLLLGFSSCKKRCDFVEPSTVCDLQLDFEIRDSLGINLLMDHFSLDTFEILDTQYQPVAFGTNTYRKTFGLRIFDCIEETDAFNIPISKTYLLRLRPSVMDSIRFDFKVIEASSECGGNLFEYVHITYRDSIYDFRDQTILHTLYRN